MSVHFEHYPGGHGDALKHMVFINMFKKMQEQHPEGIVLVDTHCGPGMYDLTQQKPPEWKKSILNFVTRKNEAPTPVANYIKFR
jgi:23S rRNA A2030 N6-methylase RlmJ